MLLGDTTPRGRCIGVEGKGQRADAGCEREHVGCIDRQAGRQAGSASAMRLISEPCRQSTYLCRLHLVREVRKPVDLDVSCSDAVLSLYQASGGPIDVQKSRGGRGSRSCVSLYVRLSLCACGARKVRPIEDRLQMVVGCSGWAFMRAQVDRLGFRCQRASLSLSRDVDWGRWLAGEV